MAFVRVDGFPAMVWVPEACPGATKRHACNDCFCCQGCGEDRCALCRGRPRRPAPDRAPDEAAGAAPQSDPGLR